MALISALNACQGNCDVGVVVAWKGAEGKIGREQGLEGIRDGRYCN